MNLRVIYEPKGKAREYAPLALNLRNTCSHGCKYCYCPDSPPVKFLFDDPEEEFRQAGPLRKGFDLNALAADLCDLQDAGDDRPVHLCFVGDPFDIGCRHDDVMWDILRLFSQVVVRPQILTKAGTFADRYLDDMVEADAIFGSTIIWTCDECRKEWEPSAAEIESRWSMMGEAHKAGLRTWLSIEPVIDRLQALDVIDRAIVSGHVDELKIGRWNHDDRANSINWRWFAEEAVHALTSPTVDVDFLIKKDLADALPTGQFAKRLDGQLWTVEELYGDE